MSEVKVYYLSKEELERIRWGAKCDLDQRPRRIGHVDWKWRNVKRRKRLAQKLKNPGPLPAETYVLSQF